jgi:hypothetical protein
MLDSALEGSGLNCKALNAVVVGKPTAAVADNGPTHGAPGVVATPQAIDVDCIAGCNKSSQGMKIKPRQIHLLRRANDIQTIDYADF